MGRESGKREDAFAIVAGRRFAEVRLQVLVPVWETSDSSQGEAGKVRAFRMVDMLQHQRLDEKHSAWGIVDMMMRLIIRD